MTKIVRSVGRGGVNLYNDVITIKKLLNKQRLPGVTGQLKYDGDAGKETITRIEIFQKNIVKMSKPDGRIDPGGKTMAKLTGSTTQSKPFAFGKLTEADFENAAKTLGANIEVAMIKAIAVVESGGRSGFSASGFPKIAFEGHIFQKLTNHVYDKTHPLLSYKFNIVTTPPVWRSNNKDDATALETLKAAMKLNQDAAYQACSWGMFQIMGENYKLCGYSSIGAFVADMKSSEQGQLKVFVEFCRNTKGLKAALASKNFKECARLYNGPSYGDYDERIRKAYKKYTGT